MDDQIDQIRDAEGLATWSLILAFTPLFPAAIVLGHMALRRLDGRGGAFRAIATAGAALGWYITATIVIWIVKLNLSSLG